MAQQFRPLWPISLALAKHDLGTDDPSTIDLTAADWTQDDHTQYRKAGSGTWLVTSIKMYGLSTSNIYAVCYCET